MRAVNNAGSRTDRGVTPVIGNILIVAIVAILPAVFGTFVLGLGSGLESGEVPQLSFDFDYTDNGGSGDVITTTAGSGNPADATRFSLFISGSTDSADNTGHNFENDLGASGQFGVGSSVSYSSSGDLDGATVRVVWTSANTNLDAQSASTLATWNGPDA